ncbi:MAG TPA: arginine--tRNA ligase [Syntrophorhabdus sp.]|nr:arginine--tRNA ligase [Syntrophorhabdus sp.]HPW37383.1 arginine--tRNA ligase [Syntrophorhabdus sp.]
MVKQQISAIVKKAWENCRQSGFLPPDIDVNIIIEIPREEANGDYSTNIAFLLAPKVRKSPTDIAKTLIGNMEFHGVCEKVEVAAKGFINFYVRDDMWRAALREISDQGLDSLVPDVGEGRKVLIEFVSSNPTGPLHIGHGRGAAVGDVLANIMKRAGYNVVKEYYVNDAGKQIDTLGQSTYARWKELTGDAVPLEEHYYQGDYVKDIASLIVESNVAVPAEKAEAIAFMSKFASDFVLDGIKKDLEEFGVLFDNYFRETRLYESGEVEETLATLKDKGYAYEKDGALWFKTSMFEKDEDRVLIKSDGEKTYFASDIAYHKDKFDRRFDTLIDIWGSDHHGYIPRMRASIEALGRGKDSLKVLLIQFVTLIKDGKPVGMSTRAGQFTTLKEVLNEVGRDAARFFFLMRKSDAHLEFDLDLAKKTTNENPVFYIQYAHARIESIFRVAKDEGIDPASVKTARVDLLTEKDEITLIKGILHFFDVIEGSAKSLEPHRITFYLLDLVGRFHSYYNKTRVIVGDQELTMARLLLLATLQQVIKDALALLGVSAPERM